MKARRSKPAGFLTIEKVWSTASNNKALKILLTKKLNFYLL